MKNFLAHFNLKTCLTKKNTVNKIHLAKFNSLIDGLTYKIFKHGNKLIQL